MKYLRSILACFSSGAKLHLDAIDAVHAVKEEDEDEHEDNL